MKGDTFRYTPQRMEDSGITPNLVRLTGPQDACNHLYFHNRRRLSSSPHGAAATIFSPWSWPLGRSGS